MRKICIVNKKGGVGKTTTALNLAAGLSRYDKKVLLIDLDPQSNIELSIELESSYTTFDFLFRGIILSECTNNLGKNLDVIRGDERLINAEYELAEEKTGANARKALDKIKGYDYVVFDCAPSMSGLNKFAMLYAKEVIIPTTTDYLGLESLQKTIMFVREFGDFNDEHIKVSKIVPTMYDQRNNICKESLTQIRNEYYQYASDPIRINSKLKEAPMNKQSIFSYASSSKGAKDYISLVQSVLSDEARITENPPVAEIEN